MFEILSNFAEKHETVSIYSNLENTFAHLTGYVLKVTEDYVLIAHITEHGFYDGYILKRLEDIYRVDHGGLYEWKISTLYHLRNQKHDLFTQSESTTPLKLNIQFLQCAKENNKIISVEYGDTVISGFVSDYNENKLFMSIVDEYGNKNGNAIIYLDTIQTIALDTDTEQDSLLLYQQR